MNDRRDMMARDDESASWHEWDAARHQPDNNNREESDCDVGPSQPERFATTEDVPSCHQRTDGRKQPERPFRSKDPGPRLVGRHEHEVQVTALRTAKNTKNAESTRANPPATRNCHARSGLIFS